MTPKPNRNEQSIWVPKIAAWSGNGTELVSEEGSLHQGPPHWPG